MNFKIGGLYISWINYSHVVISAMVNIIKIFMNMNFAWYKEYIEEWLEIKKKMVRPQFAEIYEIVKRIEKAKEQKFQNLVKDAHLTENAQKFKYEPHQKIYEVQMEHLVQIDKGGVLIYDSNNRIIVSVKLKDFFNKLMQKYPYDMYWQKLTH